MPKTSQLTLFIAAALIFIAPLAGAQQTCQAGTYTLSGNLKVTGNIESTGTISGQNVKTQQAAATTGGCEAIATGSKPACLTSGSGCLVVAIPSNPQMNLMYNNRNPGMGKLLRLGSSYWFVERTATPDCWCAYHLEYELRTPNSGVIEVAGRSACAARFDTNSGTFQTYSQPGWDCVHYTCPIG